MPFPVGYHPFHRNKFLNYQLNRWYSLGYARQEDIEAIARRISSFDDYVTAFTRASDKARAEGRLTNAATYLRASEFLIDPEDERKIPVYKSFIKLFDEAFADESYSRHTVPYNGSYLSAIRIPAKTRQTKGTVVGIPGFDAFIEEFYGIWDALAENGYNVIAFEGPGQGGSLRKFGQTFDHDYEKPMAAVLDHFGLTDVTALGISMGGYWIMRAAAYEKRISKVIAMPPVYDWLELTNSFNRKLARWFLCKPKLTNIAVRLKMSVGTLRHTVNQAMFIQGKTEPWDAVNWMMGMNRHHISSNLIGQHVLLMVGEHDAFQPPVLMDRQREALVNAASVTTLKFLKSEQADQHCQMGNLGLAIEEMVAWMERDWDRETADKDVRDQNS